jgi:AraC-like DNA-binding protein
MKAGTVNLKCCAQITVLSVVFRIGYFRGMFYLGGVGLALFLSLLLLSKRNKTIADVILTLWLLFITIHLLLFYFGEVWLYPETLGIGLPLPLVHGPFLYLYTRALTNKTLSLRVSLLHFLPLLAEYIYLIEFLSRPVEQKIWVFKNEGVGYEAFNTVNTIVIIISGVAYVILSSLALRMHRISIAAEFSNTEKINLQWLQYLIYWIGVIWIFVIIGNDHLIFGAAVLFISFIGFFGIRQVGIFHAVNVTSQADIAENETGVVDDESTAMSEPEKRKYRKSGLSADHSQALHYQLTQMMNQEKPYQESELSLAELARRLNTQPNYLSQVINEREGKTFYDYINTLRIEEFKRLAASQESRRYTLLALAEQCGFNSKSSFNRYFKKVTGQSPSEFLAALSASEI